MDFISRMVDFLSFYLDFAKRLENSWSHEVLFTGKLIHIRYSCDGITTYKSPVTHWNESKINILYLNLQSCRVAGTSIFLCSQNIQKRFYYIFLWPILWLVSATNLAQVFLYYRVTFIFLLYKYLFFVFVFFFVLIVLPRFYYLCSGCCFYDYLYSRILIFFCICPQ